METNFRELYKDSLRRTGVRCITQFMVTGIFAGMAFSGVIVIPEYLAYFCAVYSGLSIAFAMGHSKSWNKHFKGEK